MDIVLKTFWPMICGSVRAHVKTMGASSSQFAVDLMIQVVERFCSLPEPATREELAARQAQQITVGGVIGTLAHADSMLKMTPTAANEIAAEMKSFAERDLTAQTPIDQIAFGSNIWVICTRHRNN
jgi:hypothetical protein